MAAFEIEGKLHKKFETESKTESFQAREFVISVNDNNYVNYVKFQLTQDRCTIIDKFDEGQDIKVSFDLRGREWQGKFFTNLNAWRVQESGAITEQAPALNADSFPTLEDDPFTTPENNSSTDDDLPF